MIKTQRGPKLWPSVARLTWFLWDSGAGRCLHQKQPFAALPACVCRLQSSFLSTRLQVRLELWQQRAEVPWWRTCPQVGPSTSAVTLSHTSLQPLQASVPLIWKYFSLSLTHSRMPCSPVFVFVFTLSGLWTPDKSLIPCL